MKQQTGSDKPPFDTPTMLQRNFQTRIIFFEASKSMIHFSVRREGVSVQKCMSIGNQAICVEKSVRPQGALYALNPNRNRYHRRHHQQLHRLPLRALGPALPRHRAHEDRFDVFGVDGATAFGAGAIDGVMAVLADGLIPLLSNRDKSRKMRVSARPSAFFTFCTYRASLPTALCSL